MRGENVKIVTVVGARPQFVKAALFSAVFRRKNREILVHTGQHYDANMSDVFFEELGVPEPDYNLGIGSGSHGYQTGRMLEKIEEILLAEEPDGLLVYGDTNSTLAGALAAAKLHIPVFHVEAGLRSYNRLMPEELNRVLTDHISDLLLCPTETAVSNLAREGISSGVFFTGDIMYDTVLRNIARARERYGNGAWRDETYLLGGCAGLPDILPKEYYLATVHRAENTDDPERLRVIFESFASLDKPVLIPMHPRTQKMLGERGIPFGNVIAFEPVGYLLMLYLTEQAYMVITDSGGVQKEAYFLKTPCTTLRGETEWGETLRDGWNLLCPVEESAILLAAGRELRCLRYPQQAAFGDGNAAQRICGAILKGGEICGPK